MYHCRCVILKEQIYFHGGTSTIFGWHLPISKPSWLVIKLLKSLIGIMLWVYHPHTIVGSTRAGGQWARNTSGELNCFGHTILIFTSSCTPWSLSRNDIGTIHCLFLACNNVDKGWMLQNFANGKNCCSRLLFGALQKDCGLSWDLLSSRGDTHYVLCSPKWRCSSLIV